MEGMYEVRNREDVGSIPTEGNLWAKKYRYAKKKTRVLEGRSSDWTPELYYNISGLR
jgi:hypothetical protein